MIEQQIKLGHGKISLILSNSVFNDDSKTIRSCMASTSDNFYKYNII